MPVVSSEQLASTPRVRPGMRSPRPPSPAAGWTSALLRLVLAAALIAGGSAAAAAVRVEHVSPPPPACNCADVRVNTNLGTGHLQHIEGCPSQQACCDHCGASHACKGWTYSETGRAC